MVKSIPYCNEHRIITKLVVDKLCGEFEAFADLCQLVSDNNLEVLLNYVCDPDVNHDNVVQVAEYCICNGEETDPDKCKEYKARRAELERMLNSAASVEERRRIKEKLSRVPKCEEKYESRTLPARHHGGTNIHLWTYYIYTAAKRCLKSRRESIGECVVRLARALHYAQDGALSKRISIEGILETYELGGDELHDINEKGLSRILSSPDLLGSLDVLTPIQEGVDEALRGRPFEYSRSLLRTKSTLTGALKLMLKLTAYALVKFIEIVRYVRRNKKRILSLYSKYKILLIAGVAEILSTAIISTHYAPLQSVATWLFLVGVALIVIARYVYERIEPALFLIKDNGGYEKYVERLLKERVRLKARTVTRKYVPAMGYK